MAMFLIAFIESGNGMDLSFDLAFIKIGGGCPTRSAS